MYCAVIRVVPRVYSSLKIIFRDEFFYALTQFGKDKLLVGQTHLRTKSVRVCFDEQTDLCSKLRYALTQFGKDKLLVGQTHLRTKSVRVRFGEQTDLCSKLRYALTQFGKDKLLVGQTYLRTKIGGEENVRY